MQGSFSLGKHCASWNQWIILTGSVQTMLARVTVLYVAAQVVRTGSWKLADRFLKWLSRFGQNWSVRSNNWTPFNIRPRLSDGSLEVMESFSDLLWWQSYLRKQQMGLQAEGSNPRGISLTITSTDDGTDHWGKMLSSASNLKHRFLHQPLRELYLTLHFALLLRR